MPAHSDQKTDKKSFMSRNAWFAWGLAVAVLLTFASIATMAVQTTIALEKKKKGFQAIEVEKPISFFDTTYIQKGTDSNESSPK